MINLLKLETEAINKLKEIGETFNTRRFGEKTLRTLNKLAPTEQYRFINSIISN